MEGFIHYKQPHLASDLKKNVLVWNMKKIMLRFVYKCRLAVGKDKLSQKALFSLDYFRDFSETLETCAKVNWHFCRVYVVTPTLL